MTSKHLYFKKVWSSHFCWHHQNCDHVHQKNLKEGKTLKKNEELSIKVQSISVFIDIGEFVDFQWKNADVSRT